LKSIKKGDIGFLLNVSKDQLLGIFAAEGEAKLNIDPNAWEGNFPAQVKVKLLGELQRIKEATDKLEKIIELKEIKRDPYPYKIPSKNTYGPEITEKVLSLFDTSELQRAAAPQPEEVGIFPETALEDVAGLNDVKDFVYQRIIAPFEDEETAYSLGLRIGGGMLLFGPPGTGKTLIAMSIAKSIQAKFIDISPSVIVGFPGEAERRIENIFCSFG
jgi:ATPases of the AAA+ class